MTDNPSTPVVAPGAKGDLQDPSPLVREMLQREIAQLQELVESKIDSLGAVVMTKFAANDKALAKVEQYPTDVDLAIARLREFFEAEFRGVDIRFAERDKRFTLREDANKELLREQRLSSETAINKAESSMIRELETLTIALRDMKERMDRTEGKTAGAGMLWGIIVAAIMAAGALVTIGAVLMTRVPAA